MGFRPGTAADAEAIKAWVCTHIRTDEVAVSQLLSRLADHYKQLKIELPTPSRLERLAHSALQTVDGQFFTTLAQALSPETRALIDTMLTETSAALSLTTLKDDPGGQSLETLLTEVEKLQQLQRLALPHDLLTPLSARYLRRIKLRVATETLHELRRHPESIRYALLALFCYVRTQDITDTLIELFLRLIHHIGASAEKRVDQVLLADFKRVMGKPALLFRMAAASLAQPEGRVNEVIYPVVGEQILQDLVIESQASGRSYSERVYRVMRGTYSHHYRRMVPRLLSALVFTTTNAHHQPVLAALDLMQQARSDRLGLVAFAGTAFCPESSSASAISPNSSFSAKPGAGMNAGRCIVRPSARANSALGTGCGPVALIAPLAAGVAIAHRTSATQSSR